MPWNLSRKMHSTRSKVTDYPDFCVKDELYGLMQHLFRFFFFFFLCVWKFGPIYDISASCMHLQNFETSMSICSSPVAFITSFVTMFALVIAITKDLPDVEGDRK